MKKIYKQTYAYYLLSKEEFFDSIHRLRPVGVVVVVVVVVGDALVIAESDLVRGVKLKSSSSSSSSSSSVNELFPNT
jgi:hypothetical protein